MKIRVTEELPVVERCRPVVGDCYEVIQVERIRGRAIYYIEVSGQQVGVYTTECEVIQE